MKSNSTFNKTPEQVSASTKLEKEQGKKTKENENLKEAQEAVLGVEANIEAIGLAESAETTGEVNEILKEKGEKAGSTIPALFGIKYNPAQIKANLLKNIPTEKVMKRQIEKEINKEVRYLHRKAMKMLRSPSGLNYFEMSNLTRKIRELKGILLSLVKSSFENLKTLWLRFVHGVM